MKFQRIIEAVYFQPWAITHEGWNAVNAIVKAHLEGKEFRPPAELLQKFQANPRRGAGPANADRGADFFGNEFEQMAVDENGIARIPVNGVLLQHAGLLDKMCGAVSYQDIIADCREAASRRDVRAVIFDIDSPGGMAVGMIEAATAVRELAAVKDCFAWIDTCGASAAYGLICPCQEIYCAPSAFVGSIGTLCAITDRSEQFKLAGLNVELFTSGRFKGAGTSGAPMTDDWREYFQGIVDAFSTQFFELVQTHRPAITEETMQGQCFLGEQAVSNGVVDGNFNDLAQVKNYLLPALT